MSEALPQYYFRVRDNGATCFRVDGDNRQRRIEMDPIAQINIRKGEVKPQGDRALSAEDQAEIAAWMAERQALLARREADEIQRAVEMLNLTTHWAQSKASDAELEAATEALLFAMHDLRSVLVRKKADRLSQRSADGASSH